MNSKPLVSAIIIFLNAERYIEEAIESVFAQTYDNWDLFMVDDGSTDSSTRIALEYAERYPERVRYLEHPGHENRGMSASRNLGISEANGEYVAFLDADDVWLPHALTRQTAILSSHPDAGMVLGSTQYWYSWTGKLEDTARDFIDSVEGYGGKPNTVAKSARWPNIFLLADGGAPCICSALMRREILQSVGGFEEEFRGQYEDQALFVKVGFQAPVLVVDECWSRYRQHQDSSWALAGVTGQHNSARLYFLNWLADYSFRHEARSTEVWEYIQEEQRILQMLVYVQKREWKHAIRSLLMLMRYHPRASVTRAWQRLRLPARLHRLLRILDCGSLNSVRRWV